MLHFQKLTELTEMNTYQQLSSNLLPVENNTLVSVLFLSLDQVEYFYSNGFKYIVSC